jgi:hypothetical protein
MNVNFAPWMVAPYFAFRDRLAPVAGGVDSLLIAANPNRIGLIVPPFIMTAFIRPGAAAANNVGINIPAGGTTVFLTFADFGALVQAEWHIFAGAPGNAYVLEIEYMPPGE